MGLDYNQRKMVKVESIKNEPLIDLCCLQPATPKKNDICIQECEYDSNPNHSSDILNNPSSHPHGLCQEHEVSSKACLSSNGDANHCHGDEIIQGDIMSEMVPSFDDNVVCCPIVHEPFS
jgi:hypothetical protein